MNEVIPELQFKSDHYVARLQPHNVYLRGDQVKLRPMTEDDWGFLLKWNNDPAVMEYADHEDFKPSTLGELQAIYRWISTHAHRFIIEVEGYSVGECWLQRMNLRRIVDQFPGKDLRRIDLMIGKKELWGRGYAALRRSPYWWTSASGANRSTRYSASSPPTTSSVYVPSRNVGSPVTP